MVLSKEHVDILLFIENIIDKDTFDVIFKDLGGHMYDKWVSSDKKILNFLNRLDEFNLDIILKWGEEKYTNY